jgi:hypothetical protein
MTFLSQTTVLFRNNSARASKTESIYHFSVSSASQVDGCFLVYGKDFLIEDNRTILKQLRFSLFYFGIHCGNSSVVDFNSRVGLCARTLVSSAFFESYALEMMPGVSVFTHCAES